MAGRAMPPDEALWLSAYAKPLVPYPVHHRVWRVQSGGGRRDAFHFRFIILMRYDMDDYERS